MTEEQVAKYNKLARQLVTTIVEPDEYNLDEDMFSLMEVSAKRREPFILMDVGKVIGLWEAYNDLLDKEKK